MDLAEASGRSGAPELKKKNKKPPAVRSSVEHETNALVEQLGIGSGSLLERSVYVGDVVPNRLDSNRRSLGAARTFPRQRAGPVLSFRRGFVRYGYVFRWNVWGFESPVSSDVPGSGKLRNGCATIPYSQKSLPVFSS